MHVERPTGHKQEEVSLRFVMKGLKQLEDAYRVVDDWKALFPMAPSNKKPQAKLGEINSEIIQYNQAKQQDPITKLPNELQYHIWSYLQSPADRAMFALTCKFHATTYEGLKVGERRAQSAKAASKSKGSSQAQQPKQKTAPAIRPVKPNKKNLIPLLHRLQSWESMKQYKLCYDCLQFRPRETRNSAAAKFTWRGRKIQEEEIVNLTPKNVNSICIEGARCQVCVARDCVELSDAKKEYTRAKKLASR